MIRNPYLWSVFRLILSLKSSKLRIFSLKPLIFKLKYIGFQERNRDITIITHAFRTFKPCKKNFGTKIDSRILFLGFEYFSAIYFSDLSIFTIFAPVIQRVTMISWGMSPYYLSMHYPYWEAVNKTSHRFSEEKSLATFLLQGIRHLSTLNGNILYKLKN